MVQRSPLVPGELARPIAPGSGREGVREDIVSSWERCLYAGLRPERFEVPYRPDLDDDTPLRRAAAPVMDRLAQELEGSGAGLLLADQRGHVVDRMAAERRVLTLLDRIDLVPGAVYGEEDVGTNAIGTAIAQSHPSVVAGSEHFADVLGRVACTACPITDAGGRLAGVLDLTSAATDFSPLMLPLARRAAAEIARALAGESPAGPGEVPGTPGDTGLPPPGWSCLTPAERIVAGLVAEGLTNRDVAARLFLSRHTVDFHLRQIFRKLDIRSRVELARLTETAARAQMIAAADDARQRIERDLHDGLQRQLALLSATVRRAGTSDSHDIREMKSDLAYVEDGVAKALESVRQISREIRPEVLSGTRPNRP
jgi:DNA-binding CsgD family transcriptional regulator